MSKGKVTSDMSHESKCSTMRKSDDAASKNNIKMCINAANGKHLYYFLKYVKFVIDTFYFF